MVALLPLLGMGIGLSALGLGGEYLRKRMQPKPQMPDLSAMGLDPRQAAMFQAANMPGIAPGLRNVMAQQIFKQPEAQYETVQNPYGRGGVGQRNTLTKQITGYQAPRSMDDYIKQQQLQIAQARLRLAEQEAERKANQPPELTPMEEAEQKATGKSNAEFKRSAPSNYAFIEQAIETAERVEQSPYLKDVSGWSGVLGLTPEWAMQQMVPQEAVDLMRTDLANLKGSAAFEGLRAGKAAGLRGSTSDRELQTVEQAMANIDDPSISPEAKLQQIRRFLKILRTAKEGYRKRAQELGVDLASPTTGRMPVTAPTGGQFEGFKILSIE